MSKILQIGLIGIIMLVISYIMPEKLLPSPRLAYYLSVAINVALAFVFVSLVHNSKNKPKGNVNEIMIMTMIRLFASIIFIIAMIKTIAPFKWNFVMHYFIIYFMFISYEIKISLDKLKNERKKLD